MHGEYGYIEEGYKGKGHDFRMFRRLFPLLRPLKKSLLIILVVTVISTLLNLMLPYITKIAVDRYIVAAWYKVDLSGAPENLRNEFLKNRPDFAAKAASSPTFFVEVTDVKELSGKDVQTFEQAGVLSTVKYYRVPVNAETEGIIDRHRPLFVDAPGGSFIRTADMDSLDRKEVRTLRSGDVRGVALLAVGFLSILALMYGLNYAEFFYTEYMGQKVMQSLRLTLFSHLISQSMAFFDRYAVGRLVTRVTNDVQNLDELFKSVIGALFRDFLMLVGIVAVMLNMNWKLSLVIFTLIPVITALAFLFSHMARDAFRELRARLAGINGFLQESFTGMKIIQVFRREVYKMRRFEEVNEAAYASGMKQVRVYALFMPAIDACSSVAVGLLVWYGGVRVLHQDLTIGALAAFIGYISMFFRPIRDLADRYNTLQSAMASSERIFHFLDMDEAVPETIEPTPPPPPTGSVEFRDVTFGYEKGSPVLRNISFRVEPGQTVAIVGHTGAGKTSIISLLERFYEPWSGGILVDGVDVRDWRVHELRSRVGLVMQDVFLFAGDIAENVSLGQEKVTLDTVRRISQYVNADHFIDQLPQGYSQPVSEGGTSLSAGQRQLLACARALAVDPPILILDEATSNVDPETERFIQDAIGKLIRRRTTLVIAHRLSTIRSASLILVMHQGEIRESGTHEELMAQEGLYYRLVKLREAKT